METKRLNLTTQFNNTKMINFDALTKKNMKGSNPNWPEIPDHLYITLTIESSGSGKTNSIFNLISH